MTECFDTGVSDFSAMINKLKASDVDLVFPLMYLSDAILFVNQMREYDCNVPMMAQGAGFLVNDFIPSVGDLCLRLDRRHDRFPFRRSAEAGRRL